jgi:nucleoside-diphosphate-sugar epimerase
LGSEEDYEFTCLDREESPDHETIVADISDYDTIRPHFDDHDAVVHLAGVPDVNASWESVLRNNVVGTYNVLEATADAGIERFVFASSIHTVGMYEVDLAPEIYDPEHDLALERTTPVRPDSFYGLSKVFAEGLGRLYVESKENPLSRLNPVYETTVREHPNRFYSIRIETVRDAEYDHPYGLAEEGVEAGLWEPNSEEYRYMANRLKCTWLSHRDLS